MSEAEISDLQAYKEELIQVAKKGGALVTGVADANAFTMAPEGHRPTDLLPDAKAVFVVGGAQPLLIGVAPITSIWRTLLPAIASVHWR